MPIDIDKLTEAELIDPNNRVVARMKLLYPMRAHAHMLDFSIGEKVSFQPEGRPPVTGIIAKYNRKTVTVIAVNGQQWNVAAVFLRKAESSAQAKPTSTPIVRLVGKLAGVGEHHADAHSRAAAIASLHSLNGCGERARR